MSFTAVEQAIADIRAGKLVIVADDERRENEGDLIGAAEKVSPEMINFMATHARGLICMPLTPERCQALGLPQMTEHNNESHETAFTISIDAAARFGVTTGISAADRAATIRVAIDPSTVPGTCAGPGTSSRCARGPAAYCSAWVRPRRASTSRASPACIPPA